MGMIAELTGPGVEHAEEPERGSEQTRLGGHVLERAGAGGEEPPVAEPLVRAEHRPQLGRDGERDEEPSRREASETGCRRQARRAD